MYPAKTPTPEADTKAFLDRIRALMKSTDTSVAEVARRMGVPPSGIHRTLNHGTGLTYATALRLVAAVGCTPRFCIDMPGDLMEEAAEIHARLVAHEERALLESLPKPHVPTMKDAPKEPQPMTKLRPPPGFGGRAIDDIDEPAAKP